MNSNIDVAVRKFKSTEEVLGYILDNLEKVKQTSDEDYIACCPAHDDSNPSLSIRFTEEEKVLLYCHAGCEFDAIVKALGLKKSDLYPQKKYSKNHSENKEIVATYSYHDVDGNLLYQVVRTNPKDFFQRRPDGYGDWINGLGNTKRVLYNLPSIIDAIKEGKLVFIVEGEKDVDNLRRRNLVATTCAMGACKWIDDYNYSLTGADVVIIPDNDEPGRKHANEIVKSLSGKAKSIKVLELPGLPPKGDVSDYFDMGGSVEQLLKLTDETPVKNYVTEITDVSIQYDKVIDRVGELHSRYNLTDMGNAERLVEQFGENIRFCYQSKKWYIWDGISWAADEDGEIFRKAKSVVRSIYAEAADEKIKEIREAIAEWAQESESNARVQAMIKLAESELSIVLERFDSNDWLINVKNGTLNLKTFELKPHAREDFITKIAPIEFNPVAKSELFENFLSIVLPDEKTREFVQRAAGYSLTGNTQEEVLFFCYGPEATGKSTFLNAMNTVLGDYSAVTDFETFLQKQNGGGIRNDIAKLNGKRYVQSVEVDNGQKLAESLVKQVTGGDKITARFLHKEFFEFTPKFKLWMAANFRPRVSDADGAMWRRILQIPFTVQIPPEKRDPKVKATLKNMDECGSAILNWLIEGCKRWQLEGLNVPKAVKDFTNEYREEMNPITGFLEDCCILYPDFEADNDLIWQEYSQWCEDNGVKHKLNRRSFKQRLEAQGFIPDRTSSRRFWKGIGLMCKMEEEVRTGSRKLF